MAGAVPSGDTEAEIADTIQAQNGAAKAAKATPPVEEPSLFNVPAPIKEKPLVIKQVELSARDKAIAEKVKSESGIGKTSKAYIAARILEQIPGYFEGYGKKQVELAAKNGLEKEIQARDQRIQIDVPGGASYSLRVANLDAALQRFGIKPDKLAETAKELDKFNPDYKPEKVVKEKLPAFKKTVENITIATPTGREKRTIIGESYKDFIYGKYQGESKPVLVHRPSGTLLPQGAISERLRPIFEQKMNGSYALKEANKLASPRNLKRLAVKLQDSNLLPKTIGGKVSKSKSNQLGQIVDDFAKSLLESA
jgi:hypothetical protein